MDEPAQCEWQEERRGALRATAAQTSPVVGMRRGAAWSLECGRRLAHMAERPACGVMQALCRHMHAAERGEASGAPDDRRDGKAGETTARSTAVVDGALRSPRYFRRDFKALAHITRPTANDRENAP